MSYSRRQLYAMGEPLGDSATYRKVDGGLVLGDGGGGGGGGGQTSQQTQVQELPEWAKPYAQQTLAKAQTLTEQPYQTYNAPRIAGFSPLQQQAQQQAAGMAPSEQLGTATGLAQAAGVMGLGTQYQPQYFGNQFRAPGQYQPGQFSMLQAQAPELQQYQMGPAQQVGTQAFTGENVNQYMSPYMQSVVNQQQREAMRQSGIAGTQLAGQATQAGAFGGSRYGLMEAERQRNLATQLGDIQATGSQAAFQNAQQQFNQQQQANLQAQMANQQAGLTTGQQNLNALLGIQQLGAGQNLQSQLANQQALQAAQQAAEQSRQYGYGQAMTAAQQRAQYGLAGQQAAEQSRQFGAGLGLQGLGTSLQAAGTLGNLGQTQYGQQMGINQLQNQYGAQQQALQQQGLSQAYQDFLNQQNYPYKQLGFMSDILKGTPTGQSTAMTMYQSPGSMLGQLGGLGLGAYGLSRLMAKDGGLMESYAEGGEVEGYASGGLSDLRNFSDAQLEKAYENALARRDVDLANAIQAQLYEHQHARSMSPEDASIAYGLGGAFNSLPEEYQDNIVRAAGGGVVAFADKGLVDDEEATSTAGNLWRSITGGIQSQIDKAARAGQLREQMKENRVGFFEALTPTQRAERQERGSQLRSQYDELLGRTPAAKPAAAIPAYDSDAAERADRMTGGEAPAPKAVPKAAPKVDKSISTALTKMSEESGVPKEDLMTTFESMRKRFEEEGAADRKEMSDLMKSFMGEGKKVRAQALDRALAEFGFNKAAQAAQPGQARGRGLMGALQSAAAASPILAKSAAESDKIAREMDRNDQAMALNLKQFEIAQRSGNRKDAMNLAVQQQNLQRQQEQLGLQRQQLQETMRSNIAREGLSAKQLEIAANKQGLATATLRTRAKSLASQDVQRMYKQDPMLAIQDKKNGITPEMRLKQREQEYHTDLLLGLVGTPKLVDDEG